MKIRKICAALGAVLLVAGCASVDEEGRRLVDNPNMRFSRSIVYTYSSKLMPEFLPGLPGSAGSQPSTCALCR